MFGSDFLIPMLQAFSTKKKFKQKIRVSEKIELKRSKKSLRKSEAKGNEKLIAITTKFRENLKLFFQKHCRTC